MAGVVSSIYCNACQAIIQKQKNNQDDTKGILSIQALEKDNQAVIIFKDTGIGMSTEVKKKMFDPFFTTKPVGEGTGLGLSISYNIIQKHQGRIEVKSEEGKGTTITIYFLLGSSETSASEKEE